MTDREQLSSITSIGGRPTEQVVVSLRPYLVVVPKTLMASVAVIIRNVQLLPLRSCNIFNKSEVIKMKFILQSSISDECWQVTLLSERNKIALFFLWNYNKIKGLVYSLAGKQTYEEFRYLEVPGQGSEKRAEDTVASHIDLPLQLLEGGKPGRNRVDRADLTNGKQTAN